MKEITQIGGHRVEIWRRPYQRAMNLRVNRDGLVRITCSRGTSHRSLQQFVDESRDFILKQTLLFESLRKQYPNKKFLSGEDVLLFGRPHPLNVIWTWKSRTKVTVEGGQIEMLTPLDSTEALRQKAFNSFVQNQARLHLTERVDHFKHKMQLHPTALAIRGQRTRWGSCSANGAVNLNWKLLAAPLSVIDYVVVHELAHLQHLDHSERFWRLVASHHPEWKAARRWLKDNEFAIAAQFPQNRVST